MAAARIEFVLKTLAEKHDSGGNAKMTATMGRFARALGVIGTVLMLCFIFYMSSIPSSGLPSNLGFKSVLAHFGEFFALGACAMLVCQNGKKRAWIVFAVLLICCSLYGASDEFHQWFVPGRQSDPLDWLTDTAGAACGALAMMFSCRAWVNRKN